MVDYWGMMMSHMNDGNSKTTLHHRRDGFSALGDYFPGVDVEISIDSTDATVYTMMDYFQRFLISAGYHEESFIDACYKITEEHELYQLEKKKREQIENLAKQTKKKETGGYHRYRMGETGIDSENFCFNASKNTECDI